MTNFQDQRFAGLLFKSIRFFRNYLSAISVRLQLQRCGSSLRVLGSVEISGGKKITLGSNCTLGRNVILDASGGPIAIGNNVEIRDNVRIYAKDIKVGDQTTVAENSFLVGIVSLGKHVWVARGCDLSGVFIDDDTVLGPYVSAIPGNHGRSSSGAVSMTGEHTWDAIRIDKEAWLGSRTILLKGVTIGKQAVVGAGAVVTKTVADGSVVAGIPAMPIKSSLDVSKDLS